MKLQKEQQENINEISLQDKFSHLYWNPSKNGRKVQQTWWQRDQRLLIFVYFFKLQFSEETGGGIYNTVLL